jgi:hypothetical protein
LLDFRRTRGGAEMMKKLIDLELRTAHLPDFESRKIIVKEIAEEVLL